MQTAENKGIFIELGLYVKLDYEIYEELKGMWGEPAYNKQQKTATGCIYPVRSINSCYQKTTTGYMYSVHSINACYQEFQSTEAGVRPLHIQHFSISDTYLAQLCCLAIPLCSLQTDSLTCTALLL